MHCFMLHVYTYVCICMYDMYDSRMYAYVCMSIHSLYTCTCMYVCMYGWMDGCM